MKPLHKQKSQTFEHVENDQTHPSLISPLDGRRVGLDRSNKNKIKHNYEYDAIVIGAGPAGEAAAMKLISLGIVLPSSIRVTKSVVIVHMLVLFQVRHCVSLF